MDFEKLSRRNFLKKTTSLAVGVAGFPLFCGLVNAEESSSCVQGSQCPITKRSTGFLILINGALREEHECECAGVPGCCTPSRIKCGVWESDDNPGVFDEVNVECGSEANSVKCYL